MKQKNKKTSVSKKTEDCIKKDITSNVVEEGIINAFRKMEEEKKLQSKTFLNWIQCFTNGLMITFAISNFAFAKAFAQPVVENFEKGNYFNFVNIFFVSDVILLIIFGCYTFKVNKHIDNITNISDLTGISSFLLSAFATLIAFLALMLQIKK